MTKIDDMMKPASLGNIELANRLVMAPMTRSRANMDGTATELMAEYYGQRASIGLIISEGVQPSDDGQGYLATPGIYTEAHVESWKPVAKTVHDKGGRFFMQLMHVGRISHPDNTPHHRQALAPSAIAPQAQMFTMKGMVDIPEPKAMTKDDITQAIQEFAHAAKCAVEAGADGVEIHGANGYLINQFIAPNANQRDDEYGGSIENRARFAVEVAKAVAEAIGAERTGIRLSPGVPFNDIEYGEDCDALYRHLTKELNTLGLAYLHVVHIGNDALIQDMRDAWKQDFIVNRPGRSRDDIGADVASKLANLESYGQMVLANPDFVARLETGAALNEADPNTYYAGGKAGYTDYPTL